MLKLGSSKPWPDAMEAITGQRKMDASALMEFFQPLTDWLKEQNKGHKITWTDACPPGSFEERPTGGTASTRGMMGMTLLAVLFMWSLH